MSERARLRIAAVLGVVAAGLAIVGAVNEDWWFFAAMLAVAISQAIVIGALRRGPP